MSQLVNYRSEVVYTPGKQIAVSREFFCYNVKGGLIRVISFSKKDTKTLLRGHTSAVHDLDIAEQTPLGPSEEHLLLSAARDGSCFVWRMRYEGTEEAPNLVAHTVAQLMRDRPNEYVQRVLWHPRDRDLFATTTTDSRAYLWRVSRLEGLVARSGTMLPFDASETQTEAALFSVSLPSPAQQLAFSPDGARLALGLTDGNLQILDLTAAGALLCQVSPPLLLFYLSLSISLYLLLSICLRAHT